MSYKIIKSDEKMYQVLHPDGTKFTVPKKGISKDLLSKIEGLPKMASGGLPPVPGSYFDSFNSSPAAFDTPVESFQPSYSTVAQADPMAAPMPASEVPESLPVEPMPAPVEPQRDPASLYMKSVGTGYSPDLANLRKAEQSYNAKADESAMALQANEDYRRAETEKLTNESNEIAKTKLDQGKFWGDKSTENKIGTTIAILLGGIGAGLAGGKNMALETINKQIDNDLMLQKDKRDSLLNANLMKFKNLDAAVTATRLAIAGKLEMMGKKYEASAKTAEMGQRAAQFSAEMALKKAELTNKLAGSVQDQELKRKAVMGDLSPEEIPYLSKEDRPLYIPGAGLATNEKSANEIRTVKANRDDIKSILEKIEGLKKQYGRELFKSGAATEARSLGQMLIGKLREPVLGPGQMVESEYERLKSVVPADVTDIFSTDSNNQVKINTLRSIIDNNYANKLKAEGMRPKMVSSFSPAGSSDGKLPLNSAGAPQLGKR